jgi:lipid II isoglutaminyl synthase (glutamine-hydrolysing)
VEKPRPGHMLRTFIPTSFAKLSASLIKIFRQGNASSLPGRVALIFNKNIISDLLKDTHQDGFRVTVSGTNGKTTTTGILKKILQEISGDLEISSNDFGANLFYGVASCFSLNTDWQGDLRSSAYVIESDEAAFKNIIKAIKPKYVCITNIFRDQLDRFGEINTTQKLLIEGIETLYLENAKPILILNADDKKVSEIGKIFQDVFYYRVLGSKLKNFDQQDDDLDSLEVNIQARILQEESDYSIVELTSSKSELYKFRIPLAGHYNVYNAIAAFTTAWAMGLKPEKIIKAIETYSTAFGRAEEKVYRGRVIKVFLIKNPTGASEVLKHISKDHKAKFLIIINDDYADGRDVSWLWDAEWEYLQDSVKSKQSSLICSGRRAEDMALRLKYSGFFESQVQIEPSIEKALDKTVSSSLEGETLYVLPTYTALLSLEKIVNDERK